ncbi:hypothetical protein SAMN02910456_01011 [Ruminococcaceae bacterium YRB3002]|nr:hypothetical protein SAMN02910456_01011 [Ruminococcaceae bacterium YRB3002]
MEKKLPVILSIISICLSVACIVLILLGRPKEPQPQQDQPAPAAQGQEQGQDENSGTQYVLYVGTNDKDTYAPKYTQEEAKTIVDQVCLKYFEGYTLQEAIGSWTDETGTPTHEYTIVCYFDGADEETVHKAADELLVALNQNTILIESSTMHMEYYSGQN